MLDRDNDNDIYEYDEDESLNRTGDVFINDTGIKRIG